MSASCRLGKISQDSPPCPPRNWAGGPPCLAPISNAIDPTITSAPLSSAPFDRMPYESIRTPAPSDLIPGHVYQVRDAHTLDGPRVAPPASGSSVDRAASVAVSRMARHSLLLAGPVDSQRGAPELGDADYVREVLGRPDGVTEADIELDLMSKAIALGIESPKPHTEEQSRSAHDSSDACRPEHAHAASTGLDETGDPAPASQTPDHTTAIPTTPTEPSARRRSRSLSFSQYERYISQVDPALDQPKFLRPAHGKAEWGAGIVIKSNAKGGVRGFTRSIAAKIMRRRPSPNLPM